MPTEANRAASSIGEESDLAQVVGEDLKEGTLLPGSVLYMTFGGSVQPVDITEPEAEGGSTEEYDPSVSSSEEFRSG